MVQRMVAALLLVVLAVTPSQAVRDLRQYIPGNQITFPTQQHIHDHLHAKKDVAMGVIDHAKSFAHGLSHGKGKGAPVMQSLPTAYVVTSQPQIVVAPMPQLAPTPVVASAPQVQAPAPAPVPPEIRYVPVKETVVKPVIVPIPIPKLKALHPKELLKKALATGIGKEVLKDMELEITIEKDEHPDTQPPTEAASTATVQLTAPVPVPTAPAEVIMTPAPVANPTAPNPTAPVMSATEPEAVTATSATAGANTATQPAAGPMPASTGSTIIASARTAQPMQPVQTAPAALSAALPTFQPMQVVQVQNQVNRQGQIVGQMYGVAAAGR